MRRFIVIPLLAAGLALGACAQKSYPPASGSSSGSSSTAPATGTALPPPETAPAAGSGTAVQGGETTGGSAGGWVSTYPYGTAGEATGSAASPGGETPTAATVEQSESEGTTAVLSSEDDRGSVRPQASGWQNPNVTPEQHQADIEACYRYA